MTCRNSGCSVVNTYGKAGSGNNSLKLSAQDVIDIAGMNSFNNANGWADGTYNLAAGGENGANPELRHQLVVDRDTGDTVDLTGWGSSLGTVTNNSLTYDVYQQGTGAELLVRQVVVADTVSPTVTITSSS